MKSSLKAVVVLAGILVALKARDLYPAAENVVGSGDIERALYRLMPLPAGPVLALRPPAESRQEIDSLLPQSARKAELYGLRAQEDERQLDFGAAEKDWQQSAALSSDRHAPLLNLADFYQRRLQPQREVDVLVQIGNLPSQAEDSFRKVVQQAAWIAFQRALTVASASKLPEQTRKTIYEAWTARYPKQSQPLSEYFESLIAAKDRQEADAVAARIRAGFPGDLALHLEVDSKLAELDGGSGAALSVYQKQFSPLWPVELRQRFYMLLANAHQLRAFAAAARTEATSHPTAVEPVLRIFFYYEQQGKRDVADQQLVELRARRSAAKTPWSAEELKTVGALFQRVADYDEASHAFYSLYELPVVTASDKTVAVASLIDLLLDVPEQPVQFGSRDLSLYRNVATMDRHPGFLNGILSLVLNTTLPADQYQAASQTSVSYFHRAMAARLLDRMKSEFPSSALIAPREAKLFAAYVVYGQNEALVRLVPAWLTAHLDSPEYTKVALILAEAYSRLNRVTQEFNLYDGLLRKLAESSEHHPLGEKNEMRSPDYAHVLDLYISRLTQLHRLPDAVTLYRQEMDRNQDDPGIYERLALFVEQNHLDSELEQTYRAAMKRFAGTSWPEKLARLYLRQRQAAAYQALAKEVTGKFDGTNLAIFISAVPPDRTFSVTLYRQVNLYAHQRFPHNLVFVRNLLDSYQVKGFADAVAYERLLRENWLYDTGLRTSFLEYLSRTNKLSAELAALPKIEQSAQQKNTAALVLYAEGKAWLTDFETAAPAFVSLNAASPGDHDYATRAISIERSLASSQQPAFDTAVRLAEQQANALPTLPAAATLVGEIYADKELLVKAAPWWNKVAAMQPGINGGYLNSATIFWDYYRFNDALRLLENARRTSGDPSLYAYEAGAIRENQNDYRGAVNEYLKVAGGNPTVQSRLIQLAKRTQTAAEVEQRTAALAEAKPFKPAVFQLRLALLEDQQRRADIRTLLLTSVANIFELEQLDLIQKTSERLGFDDVSVAALQRGVALNPDPVEKIAARLTLAKFYEAHRDLVAAEAEFHALLTEYPNLLGVVRANTDFYWNTKQSAKAVATLEAAAGRAQAPYNNSLRREAAQKATDSADFATARRLLDSSLAADPYNGDLLAAKAATYAREGDNNALVSFYGSELSLLKSSPLPAEEKTQRSATLRRGYTTALITAKQFDTALEQYEALLNTYPEDDGLAREVARFAGANQLADRLTAYYEKAVASSPRDYRWPMVLARIDSALLRYPEAVAALDKATYVRPDRKDLFLAKADLEIRLLRFDAALKSFQKLYDLSYHDSQYLVEQASLHARLGHSDETVRLLKAAYIDAHPKELNGYVSAISALLGWRMYPEADQLFQQAKPSIGTDNGQNQQIATLEGQALAALRRPMDALAAIVAIRTTPPNLQVQTAAVGAVIDELYTPEEKASFAAKLETPNAAPSGINLYDLARASGFTELTAKRLYRSALSRPLPLWRQLETLQSSRLLNGELGHQLEALLAKMPNEQKDALNTASLAAYGRAGDAKDELRLSQTLVASGANVFNSSRYAQLLSRSGMNIPEQVRQLTAANPAAANQLTQELIAALPEDQALAVIAARGAVISGLWTRAYSALTGFYLLSSKAAPDFDAVLGPRTVGLQISSPKADAIRGKDWYYYAARYADYLTARKQPASNDFDSATTEAAPVASNSYVALGRNRMESSKYASAIRAYQQALELSPQRADVYLLLAEAEHANNNQQESAAHLRKAFELLTAQANRTNLAPEYYDTVQRALTRMNEYRLVDTFRPAADAMLTANINRNQSYQFLPLVEGILAHAPNRQAALDWVNQLTRSPNMSALPDLILTSTLLAESEKQPLYVANIDMKRNPLANAVGDAAGQAREELNQAISSYARYLYVQGRAQEAWQILNGIEPSASRPAPLVLELAAATGRLSETFAQYQAGALAPPTGEQILTLASEVAQAGHFDWSLQLREYEYQQELQAGGAPATSYLGLAQVRIEQKRNADALALVRDVTRSVGPAFTNLAAAVALLEKAGLKQNATEYAREWLTAEPWNSEASLAVGRLTGDKTLLETVRISNRSPYNMRASAAQALNEMKSPVAGTTELAVLTHPAISASEASQPFFLEARLRAAQLATDQSSKVKLYSQAIALKPSLYTERLALAEAAFQNNQNVLGLAAWQSYESISPAMAQPDVLKVEELAAAAFAKQRDYANAQNLYDRLVSQTKDQVSRAHIDKLRATVTAAANLEQQNRQRAPSITPELAQANIVKPKLTGGTQ